MLHKKANIRFSTKEVARKTKVSCKHPVSQERKLQTNSIHIIYAYRDRHNTRAPSFWSGADGVLRLAKCIPRANLSFSGSGYWHTAHPNPWDMQDHSGGRVGALKSLHLTLRLSTTKSSSHHMQGMSALRHGCNCKTGKTSMQRFPTFFRKTQQEFGNTHTHTHTDATSRKRVRATQTHIPPATPYNTSVKTREGISSNKRRCSTKRQTSGFPLRRSRERRKRHANIRFPKNGNFKPIQSTLYVHTETVATLGHLHFGLERMESFVWRSAFPEPISRSAVVAIAHTAHPNPWDMQDHSGGRVGASKSLHLTLRLSTTKSSSHHMQGMSALRHGCNCKTGKTSMQRFPTFFRKTQQDFGNTHTHTLTQQVANACVQPKLTSHQQPRTTPV